MLEILLGIGIFAGALCIAILVGRMIGLYMAARTFGALGREMINERRAHRAKARS